MATFRPSAARRVLVFLSLAAVSVTSASAQTYSGCYSSSGPLVDQGSYNYQSEGYCEPLCADQGDAVYALSDAAYCWCGNELPAASTEVDKSHCNIPCNGYPDNTCGGNGYYSVWLTGLVANVAHAGSGSSSSASASTSSAAAVSSAAVSSSSASATSASSTVSVVTETNPGTTVIRTVGATTSSTATASSTSTSSSGSSSSTSVAGIAAGVTVGVVGAAALAGGIFYLLRRRRQKAAEDEYARQTAPSDSTRKPPMTGYSQMSDSRLDPEAGNRRNSVGSIADSQDFSRRILRVANPDSS